MRVSVANPQGFAIFYECEIPEFFSIPNEIQATSDSSNCYTRTCTWARCWGLNVSLCKLYNRFNVSMTSVVNVCPVHMTWGAVAQGLKRRTASRDNRGSSQLRSPYFACLSEETVKSRLFRLPGVYARRSKRSHTGGKCVTCCGLHLSTT